MVSITGASAGAITVTTDVGTVTTGVGTVTTGEVISVGVRVPGEARAMLVEGSCVSGGLLPKACRVGKFVTGKVGDGGMLVPGLIKAFVARSAAPKAAVIPRIAVAVMPVDRIRAERATCRARRGETCASGSVVVIVSVFTFVMLFVFILYFTVVFSVIVVFVAVFVVVFVVVGRPRAIQIAA